MRIRFRASDFGQVAKTNVVRANRNRLLVRNRMRRWCSGHLFVCSCDSAVSFFLLPGKFKQTSTAAKRRVQFARPWTQASKPALTDSSLAAKRRAEALHVVFFFNKASEPSTRAAALCVLSHDT